ncbi:substrate-binding periplasmic protein [Nocardia pseudovaccinii]|uniref:substrate-binding periplasmic protein n=1 Tax=Nocardia pseudovaccinii TaxID=189540 RepID=UPI003D8FBF98
MFTSCSASPGPEDFAPAYPAETARFHDLRKDMTEPVPSTELIEPGVLLLASGGHSSPPTHAIEADGRHVGLEPMIAEAIAESLGLTLKWQAMPWKDLYPTVNAGKVDAVFYHQAVLPERRSVVDFTRPYGLFNEALLVCDDSAVRHPEDLRGKRVGALMNTTNMKLALALDGVEVVEYLTFDKMLDDLRDGAIASLVDDEIFLDAYATRGFRTAFAVATENQYAIAVKKGSPLRERFDGAIADLIASGRLEAIWKENIPGYTFTTPEPHPDRGVPEIAQIVRATFPPK